MYVSKELERIALEAMDSLYEEGVFVKALDESGELLFRNGCQVYKLAEDATPAEWALWRLENNVS